MAHNLFIAYDLMSPGQNYDAVRDTIKGLGKWHQFQQSLFYVHTQLNATQAAQAIQKVMDANDKLAVIAANDGYVSTWDNPPVEAINALWLQP